MTIGNVAYIEGWKSFNLANQVFGFNGWSSEILEFTIDFVDCDQGKHAVGISCMVRVYLRDGTFHDDIGYGSSEGQRSKAAAFEKAKKEAVTDAMKRALRVYGNRLGNCAYDKVFLSEIRNMKQQSNNIASLAIPQNISTNIPHSAVQSAPSDSIHVPNNISHNSLHNQSKSGQFKVTCAPNNSAHREEVPPPNYTPTWKPAKHALPPSHRHDVLHSDDFEALITEADLYDLENDSNESMLIDISNNI